MLELWKLLLESHPLFSILLMVIFINFCMPSEKGIKLSFKKIIIYSHIFFGKNVQSLVTNVNSSALYFYSLLNFDISALLYSLFFFFLSPIFSS